MSNEAQQFFEELLFGSGAWIGLLLILSLIFLVSLKDKYAGVIFIPLTIFMGIMYLQNVAVDSNFMWAVILMFITTVFLSLRLATQK